MLTVVYSFTLLYAKKGSKLEMDVSICHSEKYKRNLAHPTL